jgi:hypothetical protein
VSLTRSGVDYSLISNAPILTGSTLVPIGGEQKVVLQPADQLRVVSTANGAVDVIVSLLEIS